MGVAIFISIILVILIVLFSNPLRMPNWLLRLHLLNTMPIGTNIEDITTIVNERSGWRMEPIRGGGFIVSPAWPHSPYFPVFPNISQENMIGVQSTRIHLGHYRYIFQRDVLAYLAFDFDGYLIEIAVTRQIDAM